MIKLVKACFVNLLVVKHSTAEFIALYQLKACCELWVTGNGKILFLQLRESRGTNTNNSAVVYNQDTYS